MLFVGIALLKLILRMNSVATFAVGLLQMNRFDLALDKKIVKSNRPAYDPVGSEIYLDPNNPVRHILYSQRFALPGWDIDKAILCLELAKSYNNVHYMTVDDLEVVAAELMHLKVDQLKMIYRRVNHKEYEKKD